MFNNKSDQGAMTKPPIIALNRWVAQVGVTPCTAWRWRKAGMLKTVNISGRIYVDADSIREFEERAARGEFAKEHRTPKRQAVTA